MLNSLTSSLKVIDALKQFKNKLKKTYLQSADISNNSYVSNAQLLMLYCVFAADYY